MSTALMLTTCGRGAYLARSIDSLREHTDLDGFALRIIVDDSGDTHYAEWLDTYFAEFEVISHGERAGLAAAVETGWNRVRQSDCQWIFHTEDDFTYTEAVPLDVMRDLLVDDPSLAQVTLYRQPWSPAEVVAGGYLADGRWEHTGSIDGFDLWLDGALFSFNPCLYSARIAHTCEGGLERDVTDQLDGYRFGVLTGPDRAPLCWHIGAERSAGWNR